VITALPPLRPVWEYAPAAPARKKLARNEQEAVMAGAVVAQTKPQSSNAPRLNEGMVARASAAGVLTLNRPQSGDVFIFDANDFVLIDFMMIAGQWAALVQFGRTLKVVFSDGSAIELQNFFSYHFAPDASTTTGYTGALPEAPGDLLVRSSATQLLSPEEFGRSYWITKTSGYFFDAPRTGTAGKRPASKSPKARRTSFRFPFRRICSSRSSLRFSFRSRCPRHPFPRRRPRHVRRRQPTTRPSSPRPLISETRPRNRRRRRLLARSNSPISISTMCTSYRSFPGVTITSAYSART
jgi:hypothetical protein